MKDRLTADPNPRSDAGAWSAVCYQDGHLLPVLCCEGKQQVSICAWSKVEQAYSMESICVKSERGY